MWRAELNEETIESLWKRRRDLAKARNRDMIEELSIKVPSWDFTRAQWTTLNRIRIEQGKCNYYLLHKWGVVDSPLCECGGIQSITHIVESCPSTKFEEGLAQLHEGGSAAAKWLEELVVRL